MSPALLLLAPALVAPALGSDAPGDPSVSARAEGGVILGPPGPGVMGGVGVAANVPLTRAVEVGIALSGGVDDALGPRIAGFGGVRVGLGEQLAITAAGGGGWWAGALRPLLRGGVGYDIPAGLSALRLGLEVQGGGGDLAAILGVGVVGRLAPRSGAPRVAATLPVAAAPAEVLPEAAPSLAIDPPDALVWVPHPVCAWVPADELDALLARLPVDDELAVQVRAPGFLPADVTLGDPQEVSLRRAPPFGAVVVVAFPGDRVSIDGAAFPLAADGIAVFGAPEGPLEVQVEGGGRSVVLDGAVGAGYALWLRAPPPVPLTVSFQAGSSTLTKGALASVRAYAAHAGEHHFRVLGSFAGEAGGESSSRLADARAEALAAALIAAGVAAEAIDVVGSAPPPPGASVEATRIARIEVIPEGGEP